MTPAAGGVHLPGREEHDPLGGDVSPTALYRHFDQAGVLLYVGIAHTPSLRAAGHARLSHWFRFSARREDEWFLTRHEAKKAEAEAIYAEVPVFNSAGATPGRNERIVRYLIAADAIDLLVPSWALKTGDTLEDQEDEEVEPGAGLVAVDGGREDEVYRTVLAAVRRDGLDVSKLTATQVQTLSGGCKATTARTVRDRIKEEAAA